MRSKNVYRDMYEVHDTSLAQRLTLAAILGVCVAASWWLLFGGGLSATGAWFKCTWKPGDPVRRACLALALSIYFIRVLFTEFVFLKRGVSWTEVFTIALWVWVISMLIAILGGTNPTRPGVAEGAGVILFAAGSWMNSYAEYARNEWKKLPENHGRLYTLGLFRYSRHPNYLGDLISFSGLCIISGAWVTAVIPALMLAGFVFGSVPMLDAHLLKKYGAAFDDYAKQTAKLIPFVY